MSGGAGEPPPRSSSAAARALAHARRRRRGPAGSRRVGWAAICSSDQRTWVPAMVPWRATEDGFVTPRSSTGTPASPRASPGVLVVEATGIRDIPSGPLLRIGDDRFIPGLRRLVETVRERSGGHTRLFIQLIDFLAREPPARAGDVLRPLPGARAATLRERLAAAAGRRRGGARRPRPRCGRRLAAARSTAPRGRAVSRASWRRCDYGYRERVWDLHLPHIRELPRVLPGLFADAAAPGAGGGLRRGGAALRPRLHDGLVPLAPEHAGRRLRRASRAPRAPAARGPRRRAPRASGPDYVVGFRYLGDDVIEPAAAASTTPRGSARASPRRASTISRVSKGGRSRTRSSPRSARRCTRTRAESGYECMPTVLSDERGPFGRNVPLAAAIRRAVREAGAETPGRHQRRHLRPSSRPRASCAAARPTSSARPARRLADPDWFRKIRLGRGDLVRRCEFTNYCEGLDQRHKQVTCKLWDREFVPGDPTVAVTIDGKRRLNAPPWPLPP